jgi:hypothetical protein
LPYKRPQIVLALESLIQDTSIRDINPTTKRLVERCLNGEWCVQYKTPKRDQPDDSRMGSPSYDTTSFSSHTADNLLISVEPSMTTAIHLERSTSVSKAKTLKTSRSMEFKKGKAQQQQQRPSRSAIDRVRYQNQNHLNSCSLEAVASASASALQSPLPPHQTKHKTIASIDGTHVIAPGDPHRLLKTTPHHTLPAHTASLPPSPTLIHQRASASAQATQRRPAPPAPPTRRKPPAIPVGRTNGDATITVIKSTRSSLST